MAKRLNKLGYYLLGAIIVSLVLLAIFRFTSEGFNTPETITINLNRATSGTVNLVGTAPSGVSVAPGTGDSITINMTKTWTIVGVSAQGYTAGSAWTAGKMDPKIADHLKFMLGTKTLYPAGTNIALSFAATQQALPAPASSGLVVRNLGPTPFGTLSASGDKGANIRLFITVIKT